ncbi:MULTISPECIES: serine/threonine protein kinase [Terrisporobacter]|uniref:Serine/threonine protein kinase n=1 Tax=Terrisporobacter othiniensis TaxID=1577792 RepID=A0A0B3WWC3_9FIRM|nr:MULTISPECIES: serine/threonine protein kinase [Terrisporobacter]KHS58885.1 serine/threonine protein kinase [Terrisporobacter othiniensis]MCC3671010.1 serine/threonine protein kinase [Terrisporobacter mayombei]MDU6984110.1 serine/threonine protein kinase [Terrisporobacter othiniensis]
MKSYGICPASCGEFVQGILDREEYLSSYAIDMFSVATLEEKQENINLGPKKSRKAIEKVFERFNIPLRECKNISLNINSNIPIGKGMASSTADIGATIKATLSILNKDLGNEEISLIASEIEPTDSILLYKNSIFNPVNGQVKKYLSNLNNGRVIILEPDEILETSIIRSNPNYLDIKLENKAIINKSFDLLEEGLREQDLKLIGKACTLSSLANENIHKKPYLNEIIEISNKMGAYGVNIAHSGTVIGILIDNKMDHERIMSYIKEISLDDYYKRIHLSKIIGYKEREEIEWNMLKTLR